MRMTTRISGLAIALAMAALPSRATDLPPAIDLVNFGRNYPGQAPADDISARDTSARDAWFAPAADRAEPLPVVPVVHGLDAPATQIYVSGIVGASFATINTGGGRTFNDSDVAQRGSVNETIFTGGGAIGTAFARHAGLLRMEVEGRARGPMSGQTDLIINGVAVTPLDVRAENGWSAMVNFWRDYFVTDALGIYAGGGFGVGGYRYSLMTPANADFVPLSGSTPVTTFAWQVGTGFVYEISDRITLDTGYRFFAMTPDSTAIYIENSLGLGSYTSAFSASELLLSIRIYEPFRTWR